MEEKKYELVKFNDEGIELDVNVDTSEETIWLSKEQMAKLFNRDRTVISKHISNVFKEGELDQKSNVHFLHIANSDKPVQYYTLDVVISVGYRVKSKNGTIFRKWASSVLKEYLLNGYVINENRVTVSNENYIELRNEVSSINNRLIKVEEKIFNDDIRIDQIFYNGSFYDSYTLIQSIFEQANDTIIIIDNYIDRSVLDRLIIKKKNVKVLIYTNNKTSKLINNDINTFNQEYGLLNVIDTNKVHDRYIIIDNKKIYHLGASIKDLGKKIFSIIESDSSIIKELLIKIKVLDFLSRTFFDYLTYNFNNSKVFFTPFI